MATPPTLRKYMSVMGTDTLVPKPSSRAQQCWNCLVEKPHFSVRVKCRSQIQVCRQFWSQLRIAVVGFNDILEYQGYYGIISSTALMLQILRASYISINQSARWGHNFNGPYYEPECHIKSKFVISGVTLQPQTTEWTLQFSSYQETCFAPALLIMNWR